MRLSDKLYAWLLRFYPAGFREEYRVPLERQFRDDYSDVATTSGLVKFWLRTLLDGLALLRPVSLHDEDLPVRLKRPVIQSCFTFAGRPASIPP